MEDLAPLLAWAAEALGEERPATVVRRLAGGTHAGTYVLETTSARRVVLRVLPPGDDAAANEVRVLTALDGLRGLAPRLLAADPTGTVTGRPTTLSTLLPGRADIRPAAPEAAAAQLGKTLAHLHSVPTDGIQDGLRDGVELADASSAQHRDRGPAAPAVATHLPLLAAVPRVLTHYDFWSGNVLWAENEVTGVVDWSGGCLAPRGFDISWCRLDLVLLHGPGAADAFVRAYQQAARQPVAHLELWDLFAVRNSHATVESWQPNYQSLGRTDLTAHELRARHTAWTHQCLTHARLSDDSTRPRRSGCQPAQMMSMIRNVPVCS